MLDKDFDKWLRKFDSFFSEHEPEPEPEAEGELEKTVTPIHHLLPVILSLIGTSTESDEVMELTPQVEAFLTKDISRRAYILKGPIDFYCAKTETGMYKDVCLKLQIKDKTYRSVPVNKEPTCIYWYTCFVMQSLTIPADALENGVDDERAGF